MADPWRPLPSRTVLTDLRFITCPMVKEAIRSLAERDLSIPMSGIKGKLTSTAAAYLRRLSDNLSYRTDLSLPGRGGVGSPERVDSRLDCR